MPARGIGVVVVRYRALLDRMDEAVRAASPADSPSPCGGCRACCGPLSLLTLEAHALLATGLLDDRPRSAASCPLLDDGICLVQAAQPFACRARGLPARHLDAEGDWITGPCGLSGPNGRGRANAAPIAEWAALLFHLDREFRGATGAGAGRIALVDLCGAPGRYRALLAVPAGLPLASRVVT
jgi:hypothetical protein